MTIPLQIATGYLSGRRQRQADDYERQQAETIRQDRLAQAAQELALRKSSAEAQQAEQARAEQRQGALDLMGAADRGYVPTEQLRSEGQQAQAAGGAMMAPGGQFDQTGVGTALALAGTQAAKAPSALMLAGQALSKGRPSQAEQAREDNQRAKAEDRQAQIEGQRQAAIVSGQARAEQFDRDANLRRELQGNQLAATAANRQNRPSKPIPQAAMKSMIQNDVALSRVQDAMRAIETAPGALGVTNMGPGAWIKNHTNASPQDIEARAAVADIGSQVIHDRSGAAVTVSEYPRLAPFIPSASDSPKVAKAKLLRLGSLLQEEADLYKSNYSEDQGFTPYQGTARTAPSAPSTPKPGRNIMDY